MIRQSAIQDIIEHIKATGMPVAIYEPVFEDTHFDGTEVVNVLNAFKKHSDVFVTNRLDDDIKDVREKVYTRDVTYRRD